MHLETLKKHLLGSHPPPTTTSASSHRHTHRHSTSTSKAKKTHDKKLERRAKDLMSEIEEHYYQEVAKYDATMEEEHKQHMEEAEKRLKSRADKVDEDVQEWFRTGARRSARLDAIAEMLVEEMEEFWK